MKRTGNNTKETRNKKGSMEGFLLKCVWIDLLLTQGYHMMIFLTSAKNKISTHLGSGNITISTVTDIMQASKGEERSETSLAHSNSRNSKKI